MFYLCFYIWMTQNTEREAGRGRGDEYRWFLWGAGFQGRGGGTEWGLPFKCPSCVQPVREERQCRWQLVTETAGCPTSRCLWSTVRWHLAPKREKGSGWGGGEKTPSLTNHNSRPDALPEPTADQCHEDGLAGTSDNTFSVTAPHYSSFLLPFALPRVFAHQRQCTGGCRLNQVTFPLFHFFHPKFEYEKGLSLTPVKDHHFNDIWQSFDLLGFRGRGEEIH